MPLSHSHFFKALERYGLFATLIGAASFLYGVLYQYWALHYSELPFFSITQALNDWIKVFPATLVGFAWSLVGAWLAMSSVVLNACKRSLFFSLGIPLSLVAGVCFSGYISLVRPSWFLTILTNNLLSLAWLLLEAFLVVAFLVLLYRLLFDGIREGLIKGICWWIALALGTYNSFSILNASIEAINQNSCVAFEGRVSGFRYFNDKHIFLNASKDFPVPSVIPNDGNTRFFTSIKSCEKFSEAFLQYVKKDWECLKIHGYDKEMKYIYTDLGAVYNTGLDLYFSWACMPNEKKQ